jgi:hypothetical protein
MGERQAFSESFHPFRAEPHKFYIYRQYTNIVFYPAIKFANFIIKKDNGNPIDT